MDCLLLGLNWALSNTKSNNHQHILKSLLQPPVHLTRNTISKHLHGRHHYTCTLALPGSMSIWLALTNSSPFFQAVAWVWRGKVFAWQVLVAHLLLIKSDRPIPVAAPSKAWVWDWCFESRQREWMFVFCECCVLSGRGLCDRPITPPDESYRMWSVWVWSRNLDNKEAEAH